MFLQQFSSTGINFQVLCKSVEMESFIICFYRSLLFSAWVYLGFQHINVCHHLLRWVFSFMDV